MIKSASFFFQQALKAVISSGKKKSQATKIAEITYSLIREDDLTQIPISLKALPQHKEGQSLKLTPQPKVTKALYLGPPLQTLYLFSFSYKFSPYKPQRKLLKGRQFAEKSLSGKYKNKKEAVRTKCHTICFFISGLDKQFCSKPETPIIRNKLQYLTLQYCQDDFWMTTPARNLRQKLWKRSLKTYNN